MIDSGANDSDRVIRLRARQGQPLSLLAVDRAGRPAGLNVTYVLSDLGAGAAEGGGTAAAAQARRVANTSAYYAVELRPAAAGEMVLTVSVAGAQVRSRARGGRGG